MYYKDGDNYLNSCVFDLFVLQKKTVQRCMVFSAFYVRSVEEDDLKENRLYEIEVTPKVPKREVGIVTLSKSIPNYSAKKLIELMQNK